MRLSDADAEDLLGQDVVDALVEVWDLIFETCRSRRHVISRRKTPDLVKGSRNVTVGSAQMFAPSLIGRPRLGEGVEHPVGELGRSEDLVVGEVRDAGQHVGVAAAQAKLACPVTVTLASPAP